MARGTQSIDTNTKLSRAIDLPPSSGLTMMAWSRVHALNATAPGSIFALGRTGGIPDLGLYIDSSPPGVGGGYLVVCDGGNIFFPITTDSDITNYHHYALTVNSPASAAGPILTVYYDGRQRGSWTNMLSSLAGTWDEVSAMGTAQAEFPSAACFNQNFRLWGRCLTAGETQREMRSRFAVARQGLMSDLPLLFDSQDLVAATPWTESGAFTTEVGPMLGGPVRLFPVQPVDESVPYLGGGAKDWSSIWRTTRA